MLTKISASEAELFTELGKTRYGAALSGLLNNEDRLLKTRLVGTLEKDEMLRLQGECRFLQRLLEILTKP